MMADTQRPTSQADTLLMHARLLREDTAALLAINDMPGMSRILARIFS